MQLTAKEEKIARLALDKGAKDGERASAAARLIESLYKRGITVEDIQKETVVSNTDIDPRRRAFENWYGPLHSHGFHGFPYSEGPEEFQREIGQDLHILAQFFMRLSREGRFESLAGQYLSVVMVDLRRYQEERLKEWGFASEPEPEPAPQPPPPDPDGSEWREHMRRKEAAQEEEKRRREAARSTVEPPVESQIEKYVVNVIFFLFVAGIAIFLVAVLISVIAWLFQMTWFLNSPLAVILLFVGAIFLIHYLYSLRK